MANGNTQHRTALSRYFSDIRAFKNLTRADEVCLSQKVRQGCGSSRDTLIRSNLGFVVKVATEYRGLGMPFEDLLNEGNLGLIEAADRYDSSKGTKFITYAIWWIRKSVLRALTERSTVVRIPGYQMRKVREIRQVENQLARQLGRMPRRDEISRQLDRSLSKIDETLQLRRSQVDIDARSEDDKGRPLAEVLADANQASAEEAMVEQEAHELVAAALRRLSTQERAVVAARFGLDGMAPMTLRQIGKQMQISRERVRQIECQAKDRIRNIVLARRRATFVPLDH